MPKLDDETMRRLTPLLETADEMFRSMEPPDVHQTLQAGAEYLADTTNPAPMRVILAHGIIFMAMILNGEDPRCSRT